MDHALDQFIRSDVGIMIALTLRRDSTKRDGLLRAILKAAEALNTVGTELRPAVNKLDVAARTELSAGTAANT